MSDQPLETNLQSPRGVSRKAKIRAAAEGTIDRRLTSRERDVAILRGAGLAPKQAAASLMISLSTLYAIQHAAYRRLGRLGRRRK